MNREFIVSPNGDFLGDTKKKEEVCSIPNLKQTFDKLITYVQSILNQYNMYTIDSTFEDISISAFGIDTLPFCVDIQPENKELLIEQLIFDILRDKYFSESPKMTLHQYSLNLSRNYNIGDTEQSTENKAESIRKCVSASISRQVDDMNSPELRKEIEKLGVDPDEYFSFFSKKSTPFSQDTDRNIVTKPQIVWNLHYYNGNQKLITGKQYKRSFSRHNNYSHDTIAELFNTYDQFVNTVFMQEPKDNHDYFMKSMEFYYLEIYKRIDFMYKLAIRLEDKKSITIDRNHALVKRFTPEVIVIKASDNLNTNSEIDLRTMHKYYYPMLMLEEIWQQKKLYDDPLYLDTLQTHHLIRAKVYELFKYHYKFMSNDYDEISDFIKTHYNILHYHERNKVWIQEDKEHKYECDARIKKALEINEALFGYSDKRNPQTWNPKSTT